MRLVWSATSDQPLGSAPFAQAQPWTFSAEIGGRVIATRTIVRYPVAERVRAVPLQERGLVGTAYFPADAGRHPAMIVLPGSGGGVPGPEAT